MPTTTQRPIWSSAKLFVSLCALVFAFATRMDGQSSTRADRGTFNGPQTVTDLDNINLQSGSVSLDIPLASLPPSAGGKLGYTLTAHYNSKLWNISRSESAGPVNGGWDCPNVYTSESLGWPNSGWSIGAGYQIAFRYAHDDFGYYVPGGDNCIGTSDWNSLQGRYFRPVLITPDGTEHDLRIYGGYTEYSGYRSYLQWYYKQLYGTYQPEFASPIRLFTVDGTYFDVIYNPASYTTKWTIYAKDGTQIVQTASTQTITDSNGNSIEFGTDTIYGFQYAKDVQTGRLIKWFATTYNGNTATQVQYQSTGGSWQSVYVTWGTTTVQGMLYSTTGYDNYLEQTCDLDVHIWPSQIDVIREIEFPNTESGVSAPKYTFGYNSDTYSYETASNAVWGCGYTPESYGRNASYGWGQLSSVTTPGGAEVTYEYAMDGEHDIRGPGGDPVVRGEVTAKHVEHDGVTETWTYSSNNAVGSVTAPDGSVNTENYYALDVNYPWLMNSTGQGGLVYRSYRPGGIMLEKHWTLLGGTGLYAFGSVTNKIGFNTAVDTEYTTLLDTDGTTRLKMSAKTFAYDYNGDVTQEIDYDWFDPSSVTFSTTAPYLPTSIPSGATVLRVINNSYYNTASSSSSTTAYHKRTLSGYTLVLGKPSETTIGTSSTVKSDTKFSYDSNSWGTAPSVGNLTTTSVYNDTTSSWINASATYDSHGNVTAATDGNGNTTAITYGSIGGYTGLYPTQVVQAYGTSVARTMQTGYDFYTGLPTSVTDADNSVTTTTAYDIRLRPTIVKNAYGTSLENWIQTEYHDHDRFIVTKADLVSAGDAKKVATQFFDQLGRVRLAKTLEDASTQSATNETDGIKVETKYDTASGYTYQLTSNPFRASTSSGASGEETMGWTRSKAWATGRESQIETFSGSSMPAPWGSNTSSTGVVDTVIAANATTVTDQASKVRRSVTDSLGRLIRVDEPTTSGLGTVSSPNQYTSYTYDVLNNLTGVSQGSQTRTFTYNSLSRLTSAANPESGTIIYAYDSNGNLTSKTDARSITTSYTYDYLNRVTQRSYSDSTPTVTYTYDNKTNAYGKLSKVSSSVSATEYTSFDILGRVTGHKQTTASTDYTTSYTYNLSGELLEEMYPSGRMVRNTFASNGDLSQVETKTTGSYAARASSLVYNPAGAVQSLQLGNSKYETTHFNPRLQPTQIGLGTSTTDTSLLKLEYGYGTTANNGNVLSQTITVPTVGTNTGFVAAQSYTYDELNRIGSAVENLIPTGGSSTQTWKQEFSYDRYGNRSFVTGSGHTDTLGSCTTMCNPTFSSTTNRITSSGYSFDNSGNLTGDPSGRSFVYDAENKQTSVSNGSTLGSYYYDGDGKRVKKTTSTGDNTVFIYDAAGRLIAEYPRSTPSTVALEYVYSGSRLLSIEYSSATSYLTADHLRSPRINTDGSGSVVARHDYMPFGEEIATTQRTSGVGYQGDSVRKQFTGYDRDTETGLSYAKARYDQNSLGRFSSPDRIGGYGLLPQSLNGYAYCLNSPLRFTDPSGLVWLEAAGGKYEWIDDKDYYDADGNVVDEYKDRLVANGTVTFFGNGWGSYGKDGEYDHLRGGYVTLNDDGTLSAAEDPNASLLDDDASGDDAGFSFGINASGSAGIGLGYIGAGGEVSLSTMVYLTTRGIRVHQYAEYGAAYNAFGKCGGLPLKQSGCPAVYGAFAGGSLGPSISNATDSSQIEGLFDAANAGITPGSVNIQTSPEVTLLTPAFSVGPGAGGYGNLTTNTVRLPDTPTMTVINAIPKLPR